MRRMLIVFLFALTCFAQSGTYVVLQKSVLSSTTEAVTIQLPATATRNVDFGLPDTGVSIYCSAACEITVDRNGTLATTTAIAVGKLRSIYATLQSAAYRSSNAGVGTEIANIVVPAGGTFPLGLADFALKAGENLNIRIASVSATVIITAKYREY